MTAEIVYEHPLNTKIRTYLRIEHLFTQLSGLRATQDEALQLSFFSTLFSLLDVLDRTDIKPDQLKDLERCESQLVQWSRHPAVSDQKLQPLLQQALHYQTDLLRCGKLAVPLKDDKFLGPLRQRFFIPGGTCYFDLPQLHFWYTQPLETRQKSAQDWIGQLQLVERAIGFVLTFIRERGQFQPLVAENGFFQSNTEQFELLRIRYNTDSGVYPTVSGNKYRFAIRFMQLCDETGRNNCEKDVSFALASC